MSKQSFRDALCLRFGWTPVRIASHCPCGHPLNVSHAFSCSKGALPTLRHNMPSETSPLSSSQRSVPVLGLNHNCNHHLEKFSNTRLQAPMIKLVVTSRYIIFGTIAIKQLSRSLMLGFSMLMPHSTAFPPMLVTESTS